MEVLLGFLLGIVASAIAAVVFDRATGADLEIICDEGARALGDLPDGTKLEYHHVVVRNKRTRWPLPARRPAWACQATLTLFKWTGEPLTVIPIRARWSSQPSPVSTFVVFDKIIQAADLSKILVGRRIDIYPHQEERLDVAIKHQGSTDVHLFSNESYQFERGCNPAWRFGTGTYRLRVTVHYERGALHQDFQFGNTGPNLDDVKIGPWQQRVGA